MLLYVDYLIILDVESLCNRIKCTVARAVCAPVCLEAYFYPQASGLESSAR